MRPLPRRVEWQVLLRSLTVQGSWNYETLIGTGFAFSLLPVLRFLHPDDDAALRAAVVRHAEVFNSHPYLATVALGAVARLEADGADPGVIQRFKSALRGSLGSLGDQLIWSAWRPASVLLGLVLLLAGAAWWVGVCAFLVVYNSLHLALRTWGLMVGTASGVEVGKALRSSPLHALARRASDAGAFLSGLALTLVVAPTFEDLPRSAVAIAAVGLGLWLGLRTRPALTALVAVGWALAFISAWIL